MTPKIRQFLKENSLQSPCLVVDLQRLEDNYRNLRRALPLAEIFYAVKANPAPQVLDTLARLGSSFDAASFNEIDACLTRGVQPERISYGNTIKKANDIAAAHERGVSLYAFDSEEELHKLAAHAPGAKVYCRILVDNDGADWPLSKKFGCSPRMARDLMVAAGDLGMVPHGLSFHVGSQQTEPDRWAGAIGQAAMVFSDLAKANVELQMLNIGGGFPIRYRKEIPPIEQFARAITHALTESFNNRIPTILTEPGRGLVGDAGVMETEVVLVSRKDYDADSRWVYLDVGRFTGLAETMDEAICYQLETDRDDDPMERAVIAGPTCDGADILYQETEYQLPRTLRAGDKLRILAAGAYTTPYAASAFNGFPPPDEIYI